MFKVSNETKVGVLAALAITILVLGYNFLSGRDSLWSSGKTFYVKFEDLKGLEKSNPIIYRGYRVGQVSDLTLDESGDFFLIELDIQKDIKVTEGTIAAISDKDFFGAKAIVLRLSENTKEAADKSYLEGVADPGLVESLGKTLGPISSHVDSLITNLNKTLSGSALQGTLANLEATTSNLKGLSSKIDQLVIDNQAQLNAIFANVESITGNLKNNNAVINKIIGNIDSVSNNLKSLELQNTVAEANKAIENFNTMLNTINNGNGTLSLLLKDPKLYQNLEKISKDLDGLIIDINKYPKRYFSIGSGKKAEKEREKDIQNGTYPANN